MQTRQKNDMITEVAHSGLLNESASVIAVIGHRKRAGSRQEMAE